MSDKGVINSQSGASSASVDIFQHLLRASIDESLETAGDLDEAVKTETLAAIGKGDMASVDVKTLIGTTKILIDVYFVYKRRGKDL
jgi:hypothetical protein